MKLELKNIKIYPKMSEETTAFSADIYVNGTKIGYAKNDGRGGCSEYGSRPPHFEVMRKAELFIAEQPDIVWKSLNGERDFSVKSNMENWIDKEVANKENEKFLKRLNADMLKGICCGGYYTYNLTSWKNYTLAELLATPVGKKVVQQKVDELKAKGEKILNTNLTDIEL